MIILDTNLISEAVRPSVDANVRRWFNSRLLSELYTTSINVAEIAFGLERMPHGRRQDDLRQSMQGIFETWFAGRILSFDEVAARAYGRIAASAEAKGQPITIADGQIAAIAHATGFAVATRDVSPFVTAGLKVINPWQFEGDA